MPWAEANVVTTRAGIPRHRNTAWKGQSQRAPEMPKVGRGAGWLAFSVILRVVIVLNARLHCRKRRGMGTRMLELTPGTGPIKPRNGVQTSCTAGRASNKGRLTEDTAEHRGLLYWDGLGKFEGESEFGNRVCQMGPTLPRGKEPKTVRRSCPGQGTGFLARWYT